MNKNTVKTLKKSIEKWEKILFEGGEDNGDENCELCLRFPNRCKRTSSISAKVLEVCPVKIAVDDTGCRRTPYFKWTDHHDQKHKGSEFPLFVKCSECGDFARDELNFLKSLLPEKRKQVILTVPFETYPYDLILKFEGERK
jgi:hypothetical protein